VTAGTITRSEILLGTVVTISIVGPEGTNGATSAIERAFQWFRDVEARCSRFDSDSELMTLTRHVGFAVRVSDLLLEAVRFALAVAEETKGAFDPTIGHVMEDRGFNREHRTGEVISTDVDAPIDVTYRDVECDTDARTITLKRPLILDLGAVAKGLAIDMAARELTPYRDFAIDAGGDLYLGGKNADGEAWSVGIRHPRADGQLIDVLRVSDKAVCTSGDYERRGDDGHHILDPKTRTPAGRTASATVVAPTAMLADALPRRLFVMGRMKASNCESLGVEALIIEGNLAP
jgi:thiamine biosynthesis lipoprotein